MSKKGQRKREATERGLANIPDKEPSHYEKKLMEEERKKENARPSLIKRIGIGLLDFVFAAVFAGALFAVTYFAIFPSIGYNEAAEKIVLAYDQSHLYQNVNGNFTLISNNYDDSKTPEEQYDVAITSFYSENQRAIKDGKLEKYNDLKISSGYYELDGDGNYVRKEGVTTTVAKTFLEQEYGKAVDYLFEDDEIVEAYHKTFNTMAYSILIIVSISSLAFYIVIPLTDKRHRTLGFMIGKVMPVDSKTLGPVYWEKILIRNFIFIIFTFISPITLYIWAKAFTYSFIPFFANSFVLLVTRSNSGIHDYAGHTNVINESFSNPFETLKAITEQGEQQ